MAEAAGPYQEGRWLLFRAERQGKLPTTDGWTFLTRADYPRLSSHLLSEKRYRDDAFIGLNYPEVDGRLRLLEVESYPNELANAAVRPAIRLRIAAVRPWTVERPGPTSPGAHLRKKRANPFGLYSR